MPDNIMTDVQKLQLNDIAIPGQEGGFTSDLHAIVDLHHHKIYRYIPKNKEFFSNQKVVAYFEEASDSLGIHLQTIKSNLFFDGAQMCRVYESANLGHGFQLRFFLHNAYNKGTGHMLYAALVHPYNNFTNTVANHFPLPMPKQMLTDLDVRGTTTLLVNFLHSARQHLHYLHWAKQQREVEDFPWHTHTTSISRILRGNANRDATWRIRRLEQRTFFDVLAFYHFYLFDNRYLLNTNASPTEVSRMRMFNKYQELELPAILSRGYTYEEPQIVNNDEQNDNGDRGDSPAGTDAGDGNPLPGDVFNNSPAADALP